MDDWSDSLIDDQWVKFFAKNLASLSGTTPESEADRVKAFGKAAEEAEKARVAALAKASQASATTDPLAATVTPPTGTPDAPDMQSTPTPPSAIPDPPGMIGTVDPTTTPLTDIPLAPDMTPPVGPSTPPPLGMMAPPMGPRPPPARMPAARVGGTAAVTPEPTVVFVVPSTPVAGFKIEKAGGGSLTVVTANAPFKVKLSALNAGGEVIADFVSPVLLSSDRAMATAPFVAGVLDNVEVTFAASKAQAILKVTFNGQTSNSEPFLVMPGLAVPKGSNAADTVTVNTKTEKARAVLAEPPINPGSEALAQMRKQRPIAGLNDAPQQSKAARAIGNEAIDDLENCGAVSLGAICGKTSTQLVEGYLRTKLRPSVKAKVATDKPTLGADELEAEVDKQLELFVKDFKGIQNQSIYWRAQSLENLEHNFSKPKPGMPENAYGEECGEAQLAANREMLVAEAKRRNDASGPDGLKYKVVQDGLNDSDSGKFYALDTKELQGQMAKYPDGTQFQVFLNGPAFAGHWIYAEKYNGKVVMEDYQKAGSVGKKGPSGYTGDDTPHNPKTDAPNVFTRGCFIALCPESADEAAIGAWAENPKWPQGGGPSPVVTPTATVAEPTGPVAPESEVIAALNDDTMAAKITDPAVRGGMLAYLDKPGKPDAATSKNLLKAFRAAPDTDTVLREKVFSKVFDCKLKSTGPLPAPVLGKMVDVLESLPQDLLPKEWKMKAVPGKMTGGLYNEDSRGGEIMFGKDDAPDFEQTYDLNCPEDTMALKGSKNFDLIVRHEVGHDVDIKKNGKQLTSSIDGGRWEELGTSLEKMVGQMSDLANSYIDQLEAAIQTIPAAFTARTKNELLTSFFTHNCSLAACTDEAVFKKDLTDFLKSNRITPLSTPEAVISEKIPLGHKFLKILKQGAQDENWAKFGGAPLDHNGRVYLMKSDNVWYSFQLSTWANRLSNYQFASPGEWFAEFYAGANNADESIRRKCASAYPAAYNWLNTNKLLLHPV